MADTWTSPADKATNDVITATIWNQLLGATGDLQYLYDGGGGTRKYKTSTQVFTTNTTFADITAASGNFAFAIAANEVWGVDFFLPLTFGGAGGAKLQLTGPAAPTAVFAEAFVDLLKRTGEDSGAVVRWQRLMRERVGTATAFSSSIMAVDSESGSEIVGSNIGFSTDRTLPTSGVTVHLRALIQNGANAGTVTLQGAQNSSNSTTTFGLGCFMKAQRLA